MQERTKHIPIRGAGQKKAWMQLMLELIQEQELTELSIKVKTRRGQQSRRTAEAPTAQTTVQAPSRSTAEVATAQTTVQAPSRSTAEAPTAQTTTKRRLPTQNTQRKKKARRYVTKIC